MNEIIPSFKQSLFENNKDFIFDLSELGIDSILQTGLIKDIPIVQMIYGLGKTAQNIYDRNLLNQTLVFIKEFNTGIIQNDKLIAYKSTINSNPQKCEQELGRILTLLNSYIDKDKSILLAKIFKAYLNQYIDWNDFCEYSEIINRLFVQDISILEKIFIEKSIPNLDTKEKYKLSRLESLGLIQIGFEGMLVIENSPEEGLTEYGKNFVQIILDEK